MNRTVALRDAKQRNSIAEHVPYRSAVGEGIILTRDRDLVTSWRIAGVDCSTASADDVAEAHQSLCQAIQTLGRQRVAFWVHRIRRRLEQPTMSTSNTPDTAINLVARAHAAQLIARGLFVTEIYLSAVYRPAYASRSDLLADLEHHQAICQFIESSLKRFVPARLQEQQRGSIRYSDQLRFYGYLLNAIDEPMPLPWGPVASSLATSALTFTNTHLLVEGVGRQRHAVTLDLKEYPPASRPGMLDDIFQGPHEVIETQSFYPLNRRDAESYLKRQRNHLVSSGDAAQSQIEELAAALDGVASQNYLLGEYHYSTAILGSSKEEVTGALAAVRGRLNDAGFQSTAIDLIPDFAWFAQLPGNFGYRPRFARLSSRSFCGLAPLHGAASGKAHGNPWGEAVTVLEGANRNPVYFNFHTTEARLDSLDDKAPGNTLIIGPTGSGKTVLELFLLAQSMKFQPRLMLFDKDRGCEIAMRAFGIEYRVFSQGVFTGINPLQWDPTDSNRTFMLRWTSSLVSPAMRELPDLLTALAAAIDTIVGFPLKERTLSVLLQILPIQFQQLRLELARWCAGGAFGWAFDADAASQPLHDRCAFDLTALYPTREILVPVMLALLEKLDGWLDGRPFIYVITECWRALDDAFFSSFIRDKQKTIRKQNGIGIFDTQSPQDLLQSSCAVALIEQTATMILLPNPRGRMEDYCGGLKCTAAEFDLIRTMPVTDRRFLIKQGNTCLVASLDFQDRKDVLALLSADTGSVTLLESIRKTQGDNFTDWWPELLAQFQTRRASMRGNDAVTGPFAYLGSSIDDALNGFIIQTVSSVANALRTPLFVALSASITIRGFTILRGLKAVSVLDLSLDLAFQALFLTLSISSGLYLSNIVAAVNGVASTLLSVFSPGSSDGYAALDNLEAQGATISSHYVALGAAAFPTGGYVDLAAGVVMVLVIAVLLIILGGYFLIAKTALALVLCLGPIFLAACAFSPTRQWFSNWVNKLFNYVLLMALTTANVAMVVTIYGNYLTHLGQVSDSTNPFADTLDLAVLSGAIVVLSLQLPRLAAALTSGATLSMGMLLVVLRSASIRQPADATAAPMSLPSTRPAPSVPRNSK